MIRRLALKATVTALLSTVVAAASHAQLGDNISSLTPENARGYLAPLTSALSATLNSSVFQSGQVPKTGFSMHLGLKAMGVSFKDDDRLYTPTDPPGFTGDEPVRAPTVIGDPMAVAQGGQGGTTLYHPGGFDLQEFMVAVPQLDISSVAGTRFLVRWISLDLGDSDLGSFTLFGAGAQHSLSQYFAAPPVDVAVGAFYQTFKIGDDLIDATALHLNVTASKRFGVLQPYLGVGLDSFGMDAQYTSGSDGKVNVEFDRESNVHLTLGAQLMLPVVQLQGELNVAAETGVAVGLHFGR